MQKTICDRCGELSIRACYEPFASYLCSINREECDRCGTTREWIGSLPELEIPVIRLAAEGVIIEFPPLRDESRGLIFFHRMPSFSPIQWPKQGGQQMVEYTQLSTGGRLTLVAAAFGTDFVAIQYQNLFIQPDLRSS